MVLLNEKKKKKGNSPQPKKKKKEAIYYPMENGKKKKESNLKNVHMDIFVNQEKIHFHLVFCHWIDGRNYFKNDF